MIDPVPTLLEAWEKLRRVNEDCAQEAAAYTMKKERDEPGLYLQWCFGRLRARRFHDGRVPDRRRDAKESPLLEEDDHRADNRTPEFLCLVKEQLAGLKGAAAEALEKRYTPTQSMAECSKGHTHVKIIPLKNGHFRKTCLVCDAEAQKRYRQRVGASRGHGDERHQGACSS